MVNESLSSRLAAIKNNISDIDLALIEMYLYELTRLQSSSRAIADENSSDRDTVITLIKFKNKVANNKILTSQYKTLIEDYTKLENKSMRIQNIENRIIKLYSDYHNE